MFFTTETGKKPGVSPAAATARVTLLKPFQVPKLVKPIERVQPQRKRKRTSYKGQDAGNDDDDSDDDARKKKRKKDEAAALADNVNKVVLGKVEVKEFSALARSKFSVPTMRGKDGNIVTVVLSGSALGIRPLSKIPPRPLHDPMADHAIVLYDPTIDHRETDEERKERIAAEEKEKERKAAEDAANAKNLHNPHKSLKQLLGLDDASKKADVNRKVPVVIDPVIGSKLRPHQIEGVKVSLVLSQLVLFANRDLLPKFLYKAMTGSLHDGSYG